MGVQEILLLMIRIKDTNDSSTRIERMCMRHEKRRCRKSNMESWKILPREVHYTYRAHVYCMYSSETRLENYLVNWVKLSRHKQLTSQTNKRSFYYTTNVISIWWCHHINNLALPLPGTVANVQYQNMNKSM